MTAAAAPTPPRSECWVEKKAGEKCWAWMTLDRKNFLDAAELPNGRENHRRRLETAALGPKWARLCPAKFLEERSPNILVQDTLTKSYYDIPESQLLPWYEGLLVLDALSRNKEATQVPWFQEVNHILVETRRTQRLAASLYVDRKLQDCAVTGPRTSDSQGVSWAHRRKLRKDPPAAPGKAEGEWFRIDALVEYLPPWEAIAHPKCGFYQDFYMVKWAPPYSTVDYSDMENGSESLCGATWEPDECIPDQMDSHKLRLKRKWIETQREREQRPGAQQATPAVPQKQSAAEQDARGAKRPRVFNPKKLNLNRDFAHPSVGHGLENSFGEDTDEALIKSGWPKKAEDHPPGHPSASPPGFCSDTCSCMEDWHMGKLNDAAKDHLANHHRDAMAIKVVQAFQDISGHVRKRGLVTRRYYLEPSNGPANPRPGQDVEAGLRDAAKAIHRIIEQAAQHLPLLGLKDKKGTGTIAALGIALSRKVPGNSQEEFSGAHGPYMPFRFRLVAGAPPWLSVFPHSGDANVNDDEMPALMQKKAMPMQLGISSPGVAEEMVKISVDPVAKHTGGGALEPLTREVVKAIQALSPKYKPLLEARLSPIYDFSTKQCKLAHISTWVKAVCDVEAMLQVGAAGHVLPV